MDKKFFITIFITVFLSGVGGVSAFYKMQEDNNGKILSKIEQSEKTSSEKYATKQEIGFIREMLTELKDGVNQANDRLYDIQKNQVLVRVANDNVVKIQRNLDVANNRLKTANRNVSELAQEVKEQKVMVKDVQQALDKKKKKK